jgi:hypothetical protein
MMVDLVHPTGIEKSRLKTIITNLVHPVIINLVHPTSIEKSQLKTMIDFAPCLLMEGLSTRVMLGNMKLY